MMFFSLPIRTTREIFVKIHRVDFPYISCKYTLTYTYAIDDNIIKVSFISVTTGSHILYKINSNFMRQN